ncbi:TIGR04083 family peptide-modifying radical SAM enzyme [Candidatus Thiodictyon syntrophicum]|jgi:uncharacterized protein|nr:TIGR04083 family peptide-modifying radical SAM enzyme [Candidatus Thiodictyon syntrophicum]
MILPSLACPARCGYCFGPHQGPIMSEAVAEAAVEFVARIATEQRMTKVSVTLHGGEPLMAGPARLRQLFTGLRERLGATPGSDRLKVAIQSNLWLLDDDLCRLFREHQVEIGTSLDGPEPITDAQRGPGYFARTLAGIRRAQAHGLQPGCIATFTPASAPRWREVFDFFNNEQLGFSIHPALPPLVGGDPRHTLPPADYGRLLCALADHYIHHRRELAIPSLDQVCRSLGSGEGQVCTFRDCLGQFLVIDPQGAIYPCQRFCGHPDWRLGHLADRPTLADLLAAPAARRLAERQARVAARSEQGCGDCPHLPYCRGGCPYNAWAGGGDPVRDPHCPAYRALFDHLQRRLTTEMAAPENIEAVAARPWDGRGHPLLRRGPLIELVRPGPHPRQAARTAKRIVAAVELARGPDLPAVAARLVHMGICRTQVSGEASLNALWQELYPPTRRLNNLYLHVTWRCQLRCDHCYGRADSQDREQPDLAVADAARLLREAKEVSVRQVVLTGSEPLMHREWDALLEALTQARDWTSPIHLVLRSNLALPPGIDLLRQVALAIDQLVVSMDGDEATHDARREPGSDAAVVRNLGVYQQGMAQMPGAAKLYLAATMRRSDSDGAPGAAARDLAQRLGIKRVRFRSILSLGRAGEWGEPPTAVALGAHTDPMDLIAGGFQPVAGCGLGQNLHVEPSGEAFPWWYPDHGAQTYQGNVLAEELQAVIGRAGLMDLTKCKIYGNLICDTCDMRYLCGGGYWAWNGNTTWQTIGSESSECEVLKARSQHLLQTAREYLDLPLNRCVEDCPSV